MEGCREAHPALEHRLEASVEHQQALKAAFLQAAEGAQATGLDLPELARDRADLEEE